MFHLSNSFNLPEQPPPEELDRQERNRLDEIMQIHEAFLSNLEGLAIQAIAYGDWQSVHDLIDNYKAELANEG